MLPGMFGSHLTNATWAVVTVRQLPDRHFPWGRPD